MRSILMGFPTAPRNSKTRRQRLNRAVLEALEPRRLLSTDIVTNLNDSGAGSLRLTLSTAAAGDTIQFASNLNGQAIVLTSGQLSVTQNVTIAGPAVGITISGDGASTVFNIAAGINVGISNVTITLGNAGSRGNGGDIFNSGTLTLAGDTVSSGGAELGGGLYNNGGTVTIISSTFSNSQALQQGGAILNTAGGAIKITATTFSGNTTAQEAGGAICNENASMTLTGCTLTNNRAGTFGGAICNYADGTLVVTGTSMSNNTADLWGGAIFNYIDATLDLYSGCSITSNIAEGTFGGGLFNDGGTANISGTSFTGNLVIDFSGGVGGAIASELGTINISSSTFTDNGDFLVVAGGGIYVDDTSSTINSSTFTTNDAEEGGGIYQDSDDTLAISGSTFEDNNAGLYGGGALINGAAYISNSTFAANEAQDGGGIVVFQTLTLANCTISTNVGTAGPYAGGGLYANSGDTTIFNTIVAQNTLGDDTTPSDITGALDTDLAIGQTPSSNNLIGTGGSGGLTNGVRGNIVGANPNLGPLQNNGGSTDTFALLAGSPAIDSGNNAARAGRQRSCANHGSARPRLRADRQRRRRHRRIQSADIAREIGRPNIAGVGFPAPAVRTFTQTVRGPKREHGNSGRRDGRFSRREPISPD